MNETRYLVLTNRNSSTESMSTYDRKKWRNRTVDEKEEPASFVRTGDKMEGK